MKIINFFKKILTLGIASSLFFGNFPNVLGKDRNRSRRDSNVEQVDTSEVENNDTISGNFEIPLSYLPTGKGNPASGKAFFAGCEVFGDPEIIDPSEGRTAIVAPVFYSDATIGRSLVDVPGKVSPYLEKSGVKIYYKLIGLNIDLQKKLDDATPEERRQKILDIVSKYFSDIFDNDPKTNPNVGTLRTVVDWTTDYSKIKSDDRPGSYLILWYVFGGNRYEDIPGKNDNETPDFAKEIVLERKFRLNS